MNLSPRFPPAMRRPGVVVEARRESTSAWSEVSVNLAYTSWLGWMLRAHVDVQQTWHLQQLLLLIQLLPSATLLLLCSSALVLSVIVPKPGQFHRSNQFNSSTAENPGNHNLVRSCQPRQRAVSTCLDDACVLPCTTTAKRYEEPQSPIK
jgi:hypothetical protein